MEGDLKSGSTGKEEERFSQKEIKGMFEGPILKILVSLAFPIFAGMTFQLLYSIVDTIWISRIDLNDPSYVGGTGLVFPLLFLVIAICSGILIGTSSLVARSIGRKDYAVLNRTAESGLIIALVMGFLFILFGYIFAKQLVLALGASGDYYTHALDYFRYILPGSLLLFLLHVFNGILQGEGLMKHVMVSMMIATILNIILDPIFIFLLKLEVRGAAIATVIAQAVALIYIVRIFIMRKTLVRVEWKLKNIDFGIIRQILSVGFPQTFGQITMAVSFLFFNRLVVSIDKLALTAFSICGRFDQVIIFPILSIASAQVTMIGQNFGRKNYGRVERIWSTGLLLNLGVVVFLAAVLFIIAPHVYPFFSDVDRVVWYAVRQTRVVEFTFVFAGIGVLARSAFQAVGKPVPALVITVMRLAGIAIPMAYFYVRVLDMGIYGVWFGIITGNAVGALLALIMIKRTMNRLIPANMKTGLYDEKD
jgi:putative MATE family efflux protein